MEILLREYDLEMKSGGVDGSKRLGGSGNGRGRNLLTFLRRKRDASGSAFNPILRTEFVYNSTYVNVDCTTPEGVDRGIAKELATSDMIDVVYSPTIHHVARLFAPPIKASGRAVVILRNPIKRAMAKYEWLNRIQGT